MKKKVIVILLAVFVVMGLTACSMFPVYNSKEEVEDYAKAVVGEDITFVCEEKNKENKKFTYTFQDNQSREFCFIAYSQHPDFLDGASLPGYEPRLTDSYLKDIYLHHKEELDALLYPVVEENGWELTRYDCITETSEASWKVSCSPVKIYVRSTEFGVVNHEDSMRSLAKLGAQMDAILAYEYSNKNLTKEDDVIYRVQTGGGIQLDFKENKQHVSIVSFEFSTSEDERWTEESLYEYLKKQYDEDVKK